MTSEYEQELKAARHITAARLAKKHADQRAEMHREINDATKRVEGALQAINRWVHPSQGEGELSADTRKMLEHLERILQGEGAGHPRRAFRNGDTFQTWADDGSIRTWKVVGTGRMLLADKEAEGDGSA